MSENIAPILALAQDTELVESLSPVEILALANFFEIWARPPQIIHPGVWRYIVYLAGRGWGKTFSIPEDVNRRVKAGEVREVGLMAPTEDRVSEVQHKALIDSSPPWFRPEVTGDLLVWPNGAVAHGYGTTKPGRSRSDNLHISWLTEVVDWAPATRLQAFNNITTATRVGAAQVYVDSTSMGRNDVLEFLYAEHLRDPARCKFVRGSMFDNPLLSGAYLESECAKYHGQRFDEEILGLMFSEAAGAAFSQAAINASRVYDPLPASQVDIRVVAVDPALSNYEEADVFGLGVASRDHRGHVYYEQDLSAHMTPEEWGDHVIRICIDGGATGVILERNRTGDNPAFVVRSRARNRDPNISIRTLEPGKPFPRRTPGVIYIREVFQTDSKFSRASGPAAELNSGFVHLVGEFHDLENELTTYVHGARKSPNRYDVFTELVTELRDLKRDVSHKAGRNAAEAAKQGLDVVSRELRARARGRGLGL